MTDRIPLCLHCDIRPSSGIRGLCRGCYQNKVVREMYPTEGGVYVKSQVIKDGYVAEPTEHPPGSDEKLDVMRERAAHGVDLFHPSDCNVCSRKSSGNIKANRMSKLMAA